MREHELTAPNGAKRSRKRVGRGNGSGSGNYSGRGMNGQKSRSGKGIRPGFEGGQLPLIKGLPMKRGFTNIFKKQFHLVNLEQLSAAPPNVKITPSTLLEMGILKNLKYPVKILGNGVCPDSLEVAANNFTRSARLKIEAAGGTAEVI